VGNWPLFSKDHDHVTMVDCMANVEARGGRLHHAAKVHVQNNKGEVGTSLCNNAGPNGMVVVATNCCTRPLALQGAVAATGVLANVPQCAHRRGTGKRE